MSDEAETGSAGEAQGRGHPQSRGSLGSPLQARAAFLKNWDWKSVVSINRGACARGQAQHGFNSEVGATGEARWEGIRQNALSLGETFEQLRSFHRLAPFLFFNGNTFSSIGRELSLAVFSELPVGRKRELSSAVAHYIAGVLDRDAMVEVVESLCEIARLEPGDRIKTLRGSTHGVIVRVQRDGKIVWRPDGTRSELIALPESLLREDT
jgi:hypothetical protein